MAKKNKRTDNNGNCKYKELYKIYKDAYDDEWNEYFIQMFIMTGMLSFIGCSFFLYLKFYDYMSQYSMLLAVDFALIVFVFIKALPQVIELSKIMEFSTDRIRGVRCTVCEKKSAKSKDLINRSRNTFAAGKMEDGTMIYADCTVKQYEQIVVNETTGLFYVFEDDDKIRIVAE